MKHLLELNMSCYLLVSVLFFIICTGALSAQTSITARVGSTTVLPCEYSNAQSSSQSPHVEWRNKSHAVFQRSGEKVYQEERYKDRVDVPEDQLLKGTCSLVLKDVRIEDAGVYESYLLVKQTNSGLQSKSVFLQRVVLSVEETTDTNDTQSDPSDESRNDLSPGMIIGVIVGVISLVLLGAVIFFIWRKRKNGNAFQD